MMPGRLAAAVSRSLVGNAPKPDFLPFIGGLDIVSSPLTMPQGRVVEAQNFEAVNDPNGGYRRVAGYERMDGRPRPSEAPYAILNVVITGAFAAGDAIVGVTSAATAVVLAVVSGSPNYLVITKITGTFANGETLNVSGNPQGTTSSEAVVDGAATGLLHATYKNLAADEYRDDIGAVPGSGEILGVFSLAGVRYAFRNNVGGTAAALYKSSLSGWTAVALGRELEFTDGGATEIEDGDTITGATSGATAVVTRVVLEAGTWENGTARGRFIFASQTGTFQTEDINVGASTSLATIAGDSAAITQLPDGRYEFDKENFTGLAGNDRIYGADGVNRGFEFDGTVFVPLRTGMTLDAPSHVMVHKNHLFFSFHGSVQHSGLGKPYQWTLRTGAAELAMGDEVSGFIILPGEQAGGALLIFTRNRTKILYGSSVADWNLVPYRRELGAFAYSIQDIGFTMFLDDRGFTNLQATQKFGNFVHATISQQIQPLMNEKRSILSASCISRDLSQYRAFFSDGSAFYVTVYGSKILGIMPMLFPDVVRCAWSVENDDGTEEILFGSDGGWVFEMERGTSFDGDAIDYFFGLPYHFSRSPRIRKRYRGGEFEITGSGYAEFSFTWDLGYGTGDAMSPMAKTLSQALSAGRWDTGTWDTGFWDARTLAPVEFELRGTSENIALRVAGSSDMYEPFTFHMAMIEETMRRRMRGRGV